MRIDNTWEQTLDGQTASHIHNFAKQPWQEAGANMPEMRLLNSGLRLRICLWKWEMCGVGVWW